MSLINEALRKAQRQRDEAAQAGSPQPPRVGPVPRVAKRGAPLPARTVVLISSISAAVIAVGVLGFLWFTRAPEPLPLASPASAKTPATPPAATPATSAASAPSTLPASASAPENNIAATPATAPTTPAVIAPTVAPASPATALVTPAPAPSPAPVAVVNTPAVTAPAPASTVATSPVTADTPQNALAPTAFLAPTAAPPVVAAAPTPTPTRYPNYSTTKASGRPDMRVYEFLDKTRITGIRQSETDPKVLMNDRVFRLNDVVDNTTGLRLRAVAVGMLTFVDEAGVEYTRSF